MHRPIYNNADAMRREWQGRAASHRFFALGDSLEKLADFLNIFDVSKAYPEKWWAETLGCQKKSCRGKFDFNLGFIRSQMFDLFNDFICYSIPTWEALELITEFVGPGKIYEHMAGTGYWAYLLKRRECNIEAFDGWDDTFRIATAKLFTDVAYADVETAELPRDATLMLSWVPHGSNAPLRMLGEMASGQKLIYIADRGCCGGSDLHRCIDRNFVEVSYYDFPQMLEVGDAMWLYRKV